MAENLLPRAQNAVKSNTPKMSLDEAYDRFLAGEDIKLVGPTDTLPKTNVPDIRNAPSSSQGQLVDADTAAMSAFKQEATRPGTPLDVSSGAPTWERMVANRFSQKAEELDYWRQLYGPDKVDVVNGKFVLRDLPDLDNPGKTKDLLVDEEKVTGKDMAVLLAEAPELALSIAASLRYGGANLLRQSAVGAAAYSGLGGLTEMVARGASGMDPRIGEEVVERGKEAALDTATGAALGGIGKGIQNLINVGRFPLSGGTSRALEGQLGRQELGAKMGEDWVASLAERTGNQSFATAESYAEKIPLVRGSIQNLREARIAQERRFQRQMMGDEKFPDFNRRTMESLGKEVKPQMEAVEMARKGAVKSASKETIGALETPVGTKGLSSLDLGTRLQQGAQEELTKFKTERDRLYSLVDELPEASQDVFPLKPVAARAKKILDELPSVPGEEGREIMQEFATPALRGLLETTAARGNQKTRLSDLVRARDRIWDMIGKSEALPDVSTKDLKELSNAITQAIDQGAKALPDQELSKRLTAANEFYKKNIGRFEQKGVRELLVPPGERGEVNLESYANSIFAGGKGSAERFNKLKEFFGGGSQAVADIKQYFLDNILDRGVDPVTRVADFKDILTSMQKLSPEIKKELFGNAGITQNIEDAARFGLVAEGKVSMDAVKDLIASNQLTRGNINNLIQEQAKLDSMLQNQVKKAVADGFIDPSKINPDEFVERYLLDPKIPVKDVREAIATISADNPELLSDIRRKTLSDTWRKVQRTSLTSGAGGEDVFRRGQGDLTREIDPQKMILLLDDPKERARLETILGEESYRDLKNYVRATGARAGADALGGMAGAQARGSIIGNLVNGLDGLSKLAQWKLASFILTDQRIINQLSRPKPPVEMKKFIRALTMTPQFARAMVDDMPDELERAHLAREISETLGKAQEFSPAVLP